MENLENQKATLDMFAKEFKIEPSLVTETLTGLVGEKLSALFLEMSEKTFAIEQLTERERSIAIIAALLASGGLEKRLENHFQLALANGIDQATLESLLLLLTPYVGIPKVSIAAETLKKLN